MSIHPKKRDVATPKFSVTDLDVLPKISVREWLHHTNTMVLYDWFPLTYFTISSVLAPNDNLGCKSFTMESALHLMYWVYAPILAMRFVGLLFFNKSHLIIWQILVIYGFQVIALSIWEFQTMTNLKTIDHACFRPLQLSTLNVMLMSLFYLFVLAPLYTMVFMLPYYLTYLCSSIKRAKEQRLGSHYLIKAMPSVLFNKKLFETNNAECVICAEPFVEGQDYVTPLYCDHRHYYHSDCIESWLVRKNECPLCKKLQTPN